MLEYVESLWQLLSKFTLAIVIDAITKAKFTFSAAFVLILNRAFNFLDDHSAAIGALVCILSFLMNVAFKILERRDKKLAYSNDR